jgi:hypothetical protein
MVSDRTAIRRNDTQVIQCTGRWWRGLIANAAMLLAGMLAVAALLAIRVVVYVTALH